MSRIYCSMFSIKQIEHLLVHAQVSTGHTHLDRPLVGVFNWCLLGNSSFPINFELLAVVSQLCLPASQPLVGDTATAFIPNIVSCLATQLL